jgi:hypothetical protein
MNIVSETVLMTGANRRIRRCSSVRRLGGLRSEICGKQKSEEPACRGLASNSDVIPALSGALVVSFLWTTDVEIAPPCPSSLQRRLSGQEASSPRR